MKVKARLSLALERLRQAKANLVWRVSSRSAKATTNQIKQNNKIKSWMLTPVLGGEERGGIGGKCGRDRQLFGVAGQSVWLNL